MIILHTDPSIVVVNKPGGLLSVPGRGPEKQDCIVNRIKTIFHNCIAQPSVHRLDMQTSGIMVLALTREAHRNISLQFEKRRVEKRYVAHLQDIIDGNSGEIKLAFRLDINRRPYQIYDPINGKQGISKWRKLGDANGKSIIEFQPVTGRTHQLRLHASHNLGLNSPIVGDSLYGEGKEGDKMLLHATYLSFIHPVSGKKMEFTSPPPF